MAVYVHHTTPQKLIQTHGRGSYLAYTSGRLHQQNILNRGRKTTDKEGKIPAPARTETERVYVRGDIQMLELIPRRMNQETKPRWKKYFISNHVNFKNQYEPEIKLRT